MVEKLKTYVNKCWIWIIAIPAVFLLVFKFIQSLFYGSATDIVEETQDQVNKIDNEIKDIEKKDAKIEGKIEEIRQSQVKIKKNINHIDEDENWHLRL